MSLRLDYRQGSGELEKLFTPYGIKVERCTLEFGDLAFEGRGPGGAQVGVVVERKRIEDLLQSIESKRLSGHQLPGMAEQYDYCYLIVEGLWRPSEDGSLEIHSGGGWRPCRGRSLHYRSVDGYLSGLELRAGVIYRRTASPRETVEVVVGLYRGWTEKAWDDHKCHEAVYAPAGGGRGRRMTLKPRRVGLAEKIAMQLPGIDSKARGVSEYFEKQSKDLKWEPNYSELPAIQTMFMAGTKVWEGAPGVGKVGAKRIVEAIRNGTA